MKKKRTGIYLKLIVMTVIPMLVMGIVITISAFNTFRNSMSGEVRVELGNVANTVADAYDIMYPGDYSMVGKDNVAIVKGESVISTHTELIDSIKSKSNVEVSVFYYNTRIVTTITDDDGNRLTGSVVNSKIETDVLKNHNEGFYDNASLDQKSYYAYYVPLFNADSTCVGMVAVAKPASQVDGEIYKAVFPIIVIAFIAMIIAGIVSSMYSKNIVALLEKIRKYLNNVSKGNLNEDMDIDILKRDDEIGEIGSSIMNMRNSLKEMVEIDALTGINNRRSGENKLKDTQANAVKSGMPFSIALGDIDFFKKVNDSFGHECGDEVLKSIAFILKKNMLGKGYAVRWGGEEFLLVFDSVDYDEARIILNDIIKEIRIMNVEYDKYNVNATMTFGILEGKNDIELHHQIKEADDLLYTGKQEGRNRIVS